MSALPAMPFVTRSGGALIASPSLQFRQQIVHRLNGRCRPIEHAGGGAEALAKLEKTDCQILFVDRRLPDLDPEELKSIIALRFPRTEVVLIDSSAPDGERDGEVEEDAFENGARRVAVRKVREEVPEPARAEKMVEPLPGMIGTSPAMQRVYRMVRLVAYRPTTVLIAGPTGTGKELVARAIHTLSPRLARPLVVVNCAAIPETLLESELFGYTRGAFTGAVQSQLGRIPAAHGGTLFLDEISDLPLSMQAKLLRFLEQKEVQRLGSPEVSRVDVRVVAASNVDLAGRAERGEFRQDLFYRLSAFPIELPPLAARRTDIVPLAEHFLACMAAALQTPVPRLSPEVIRRLEDHPWQGNVRELQHVMERASILVENADTIDTQHLYFSGPQSFGLQTIGPRHPLL